jgi:hypothetical protein
MSILTVPQARIQLAWVDFQGQRLPCYIDIEWNKAIATIADRVGGVSGTSTTELTTMQFEDAGIEELKQAVYQLAMDQTPPQSVAPVDNDFLPINSLRAEVEALRTEIQNLKQGLTA